MGIWAAVLPKLSTTEVGSLAEEMQINMSLGHLTWSEHPASVLVAPGNGVLSLTIVALCVLAMVVFFLPQHGRGKMQVYIVWEYQYHDDWYPFPKDAIPRLEDAYWECYSGRRGSTFKLAADIYEYVIDLKEMTRVNLKYGTKRMIRRSVVQKQILTASRDFRSKQLEVEEVTLTHRSLRHKLDVQKLREGEGTAKEGMQSQVRNLQYDSEQLKSQFQSVERELQNVEKEKAGAQQRLQQQRRAYDVLQLQLQHVQKERADAQKALEKQSRAHACLELQLQQERRAHQLTTEAMACLELQLQKETRAHQVATEAMGRKLAELRETLKTVSALNQNFSFALRAIRTSREGCVLAEVMKQRAICLLLCCYGSLPILLAATMVTCLSVSRLWASLLVSLLVCALGYQHLEPFYSGLNPVLHLQRAAYNVPSYWSLSPHHINSYHGIPNSSRVPAAISHRIQALMRGSCHDTTNVVASRCKPMSRAVVEAVYRIESVPAWVRFVDHRDHMQRMHGSLGLQRAQVQLQVPNSNDFFNELEDSSAGSPFPLHAAMNEVFLFHGSPWEAVPRICQQGFDDRLARDTHTMYGIGTYFSPRACKAAQYCQPDSSGMQALFISRVLVGEPYLTPRCRSAERLPPELPHHAGERYDSIIAREGPMEGHPAGHQSHMEIMAPRGTQAYAEYLVIFRTP